MAFCTGKPKPPVHTGIGTIRESLALEVEKQEDSRKGEIFFAENRKALDTNLSDPEWIEQELHGKIKNKNEIKQEQIGHHDKFT